MRGELALCVHAVCVTRRYLMFCLDFEYAEMRLSDAHGGQMDMITFPEFAKVWNVPDLF